MQNDIEIKSYSAKQEARNLVHKYPSNDQVRQKAGAGKSAAGGGGRK